MKSVILSLLVLGVCIMVATAYPTYPINRQYMPRLYDRIQRKFCGYNIIVCEVIMLILFQY